MTAPRIEPRQYKWTPAPGRRQATRRVILHCSATQQGRAFTAADIDRWHRHKGWAGIGYHYVVRLDGAIEEGRPEWAVGAHCAGHNAESIGVCYIGGLAPDGRTPKDTRTPEQKKALLSLVRWLMDKYDLPAAAVHAHRDYAAKACPSFTTAQFLKELNGC